MDREPAAPETFFGKYAAAYTTSERHARGADLAVLVEALAPRPEDRVLDVATGTGHTG
ncbi:Methyltransferase type 11, partial [mine drainage metagenome]